MLGTAMTDVDTILTKPLKKVRRIRGIIDAGIVALERGDGDRGEALRQLAADECLSLEELLDQTLRDLERY